MSLLTKCTPEPAKEVYRWMAGQIPFGLRFGRHYRQFARMVDRSQWWPIDRLCDYQNEKLRRLIRHCYENVPYYRSIMDERGLTPADITSAADLQKLPFLTKELVRENYDRLKAKNFENWPSKHAHSGGTSGDPLNFMLSQRAALYEWACVMRAYAWAGYREGMRCVYLRVPLRMTYADGSPRLWYYSTVWKWLALETNDLSEPVLETLIDKIVDYKTEVISIFPSNLEVVSRYLLNRGRRIPNIKAIVTSAETLMPHQRSLARQAFGIEPFDWYGQGEHVASAAQCPEGNYHVNMEYCLAEVLDSNGSPVTEGAGEVVGTCLDNYTQPFIRYQLGDIVKVASGPCPCGRKLPIWERIDGRAWAMLVRPDGQRVSPIPIFVGLWEFFDTGKIGMVQFQQLGLRKFRLYVVRDSGFSPSLHEQFVSRLSDLLGEGVDVDRRFVKDIPRTAAGKHQLFVSNLNDDAGELLPADS